MRGTDNTTLYVVIAIVALHFVVGIGYLLYKISKSEPRRPTQNTEEPDGEN